MTEPVSAHWSGRAISQSRPLEARANQFAHAGRAG